MYDLAISILLIRESSLEKRSNLPKATQQAKKQKTGITIHTDFRGFPFALRTSLPERMQMNALQNTGYSRASSGCRKELASQAGFKPGEPSRETGLPGRGSDRVNDVTFSSR